MTSRPVVVASVAEGTEDFDLVEADWLVYGSAPEIVHVVTPAGLDQLLTFLDSCIEVIGEPRAAAFIFRLFSP
jgi:biotin synthase-related radical SAM superfamily protein